MTQTSELKRSPVENGSGSLNDRVRSLRLTQPSAAKSRTAVLPWALCIILLLTSAVFGYRAYRDTEHLRRNTAADAPSDATGRSLLV